MIFAGMCLAIFQSTLPARGATQHLMNSKHSSTHFNPRSPHGERRRWRDGNVSARRISIHAPRTGSDTVAGCCLCRWKYFNPRSPHGERPSPMRWKPCPRAFQSTLPARGATGAFQMSDALSMISIHAPRTGSDGIRERAAAPTEISIHAPRTGSDSARAQPPLRPAHFNPRSPHGERRLRVGDCAVRAASFQSTLPARGATRRHRQHIATCTDFNPRSPHGERRYGGKNSCGDGISIHAPRTGSDEIPSASPSAATISIHAPRTGSDKT